MTRDHNRLSDKHRALGEAGLVTTDVLVEAAAEPRYRRVEVAALYGVAIAFDAGHIDWRVVNRAIRERWSKSGLETIKRWAWGGVKAVGAGAGTERPDGVKVVVIDSLSGAFRP